MPEWREPHRMLTWTREPDRSLAHLVRCFHALRRVGERRAALIGLGLCALGLVGMAGVTAVASFTMLILATGALAIGEGIFIACLGSTISRRASPEDQGRVQGGGQSVQSAMQACAPIAGGFLYSRVGPAVPYLLGAALVILAARLFANVRPSSDVFESTGK